jgi:hypothetical protein
MLQGQPVRSFKCLDTGVTSRSHYVEKTAHSFSATLKLVGSCLTSSRTIVVRLTLFRSTAVTAFIDNDIPAIDRSMRGAHGSTAGAAPTDSYTS